MDSLTVSDASSLDPLTKLTLVVPSWVDLSFCSLLAVVVAGVTVARTLLVVAAAAA